MTSWYYSSEHILNVFVDAGVDKMSFKSTMSASGVMVYYKDRLIHSSVTILKQSTNNIGELLAILIGVNTAIGIKREINKENPVIERINIYSDSSYSVDSITRWYSRWLMNGRNEKDGSLYTLSGKVKNQELIEAIIRSVIVSNERINFVKVRGHQNPNNGITIDKNMGYIIDSNRYTIEKWDYYDQCECYVNTEITKSIIERNNLVDQLAGSMYPTSKDEYNLLPTIRDILPMVLYNITPEEYERFELLTHFHEYN